ncbi:MAG: hypothetical protein JWP97_4084 [Labilithrix sp.]|nr:hypothetical protein [Labilithrix sp.]
MALPRKLLVVAASLLGTALAPACSSFSAAPDPSGPVEAGGDDGAVTVTYDASPAEAGASDGDADAAPPALALCGTSTSRGCKERYVFVTRGTLRGDFGAAVVSDALPIADAFCAVQANADPEHEDLHGRTWRAWMCTSSVDAAGRLGAPEETQYIRPDGQLVYLTESALLHDNPETPIDDSPLDVWTGCAPSGLREASPTCGNWKIVNANATAGRANDTSRAWSRRGELPCTEMHPVYCFEWAQ